MAGHVCHDRIFLQTSKKCNSSFSVCAPPFSEYKILGAESAQLHTQLSCFQRESTLSFSSFSSSSTKWSHLFAKHTSYQHFQAFFHFSVLCVERINCSCIFSITCKSSLVCQCIHCWNLTVCFSTLWGICLLCMTTTPPVYSSYLNPNLHGELKYFWLLSTVITPLSVFVLGSTVITTTVLIKHKQIQELCLTGVFRPET